MRVLVTGMGGGIGARVAQLLEDRLDVDAVVGCDMVAPRRKYRRAEFHRIDPRDTDALEALVVRWRPDAVAHLGVYEPDARLGAAEAAACTAAALSAVAFAAATGELDRLVCRSGLEVYGRGGRRPLVPAEHAPVAPTTPYGRDCTAVEAAVARAVHGTDAAACALRFAPVFGSHGPSPLARVLRLPLVPVPLLADPPFSVVHEEDAAHAVVEALVRRVDGPCNVLGPGATSPRQAARLGGRLVLPLASAAWPFVQRAAAIAGAPMPAHVLELLRAGRTADGSHAVAVLGLHGWRATPEVVTEQFELAAVVPLPREEEAA